MMTRSEAAVKAGKARGRQQRAQALEAYYSLPNQYDHDELDCELAQLARATES